jgi:pectin methylesterase-like acyl-CoA thioesterase
MTIFIRNGNYEELVYLKGKSNLILRGESRDGVVVGYANNSAFNRIRPTFSVTESSDIQLSTFIGQAEALLMRGERNIVERMTLNGSGDAFTTGGTIYMVDSKLTGDGDTILGYAALYCLRCEIHSVGPFTWTRTPEGSHGNVFVDSTLIYTDKPLPWSINPQNPAGRKAPGVLARLRAMVLQVQLLRTFPMPKWC